MDPITWSAIISGVGAILGGLLSGGSSSNQAQTQTTTTPARGYQDPMLGLYSMLGSQLSLGRYNSLAGAGMPGGQGFTGNSSNVLSLLSSLIPELSGAMQNGGLKKTVPAYLQQAYDISNSTWVDAQGRQHHAGE